MRIKILLLLMPIMMFGQIPNTLTITENYISFGTDFSTSTNINFVERMLSFGTKYEMLSNGIIIVTAKQKPISFGTKIVVTDNKNKTIGYIEEELFTNWGFYSRYKIYDSMHKLIAVSEKHKFMSTEFNIKDTSGRIISKITKPAFNFGSDKWTVNFYTEEFDRRLLIFIPCFKTNKDNKDD